MEKDFFILRQMQVYKQFFEIENLLRVAMHNIMVRKKGINYFTKDNFPVFTFSGFGRTEEVDVTSDVLKRRSEEKKYRENLGYKLSEFWYIDYLVLISILENFWSSYFGELFINPKNVRDELLQRLYSLRLFRNAIAHNRYLLNVDAEDINSCHYLLNNVLRKEFVTNYDEIVFNEIETNIIRFSEMCDNIEQKFNECFIIPRDLLRSFRSLYSVLYTSLKPSNNIVTAFDDLYNVLELYNKLPRKPGDAIPIRNFVQTHNLQLKLNFLKQIFYKHDT